MYYKNFCNITILHLCYPIMHRREFNILRNFLESRLWKDFLKGRTCPKNWIQISRRSQSGSAAELLGPTSSSARARAGGHLFPENDQHRWGCLGRSLLPGDPGRGNMGGQKERGRQRFRGGGHASWPLHRAFRRDFHDDGDLGRRWLHQRHRGGDLHQGPGLVPSTFRIRPEPRFRWVQLPFGIFILCLSSS